MAWDRPDGCREIGVFPLHCWDSASLSLESSICNTHCDRDCVMGLPSTKSFMGPAPWGQVWDEGTVAVTPPEHSDKASYSLQGPLGPSDMEREPPVVATAPHVGGPNSRAVLTPTTSNAT